MQVEVHELEKGQTSLVQTAFFAPDGVAGLVYWYVLYPIHRPIFSGMIRKIGEKAEAEAVAQFLGLSPEQRMP